MILTFQTWQWNFLYLFCDFINLTKVHNFTVNAQDNFTFRFTSVIYHNVYRNLANTNADNKTFYNVLLSQTVMVQCLQLESTRDLDCFTII